MVVDNFYFVWRTINPFKTNSILFVNTNAVLSFPVAIESLKIISRRNLQVIERTSGIDLFQFSNCNFYNILRTRLSRKLTVFAVEDVFSSLFFERPYHEYTVTRLSCYVKWVNYLR